MISARRLPHPRRCAALAAVCTLIAVLLGTGVPTASATAAPTQPSFPSPVPAAPGDGTDEETAGSPGDSDIAAAGVELAFDEISPVVTAEGTLTIKGRIINSSAVEIPEPRLDFRISRRVLDSRDAINEWKDQPARYRQLGDTASAAAQQDTAGGAEDADDAPRMDIETLPESVAPKSEAAFTLTADAETLGLPRSQPLTSWGAYGLAVKLSSEAAAASAQPSLSLTRTAFTTWYPDPQLLPSKVTFLVPVTLPGFDPSGQVAADTLEQAAGPERELTSALAAVTAADEVALAVDPRLIGSIEDVLGVDRPEADPDDGAGDPADGGAEQDADPAEPGAAPADETPADTETPEGSDGEATEAPGEDTGDDGQTEPAPSPQADRYPQLNEWYTSFVAAAEQRTVIALPYADADLTALSAADESVLARAAEAAADDLRATLPEARTDITWPASGSLTPDFAERAAQAGAKTMLVSDIQQPSVRSYTSSAPSTLPVGEDQHGLNSLAVDTGLSEAAELAGHDDTRVLGLSELIAESSAITTERPFDPRSLLITLPRRAADPHWAEAIRQTAAAPWIDLQSLADLSESEPVQRAPLTEPTREAGDRAAGLNRLGEVHSTGAEASTAFADPEAVATRLSRATLTCTSTAWGETADDSGFSSCVDAAAHEVDALIGGVKPEEGSAVLLVTGEKTTIPVRIDNTTAESAHVMVRVVPATPQLRTQVSEPVVVSPGEQARVEVPVEGLANADVQTRIELVAATPPDTTDATGTNGSGPGPTPAAGHFVLPETTSLTVRVRTDWENIGAAVIGSGLVVVLLIGLYSSVSRGRRKIPKSQLDAAVARAHENDPG
ncbi:DUF6049 family protein [Brevibacterium luteolum]|uniref:2-oxoglutarate dehydrogenase n=1 Tax=Brevibacterium luteolum TaxID=199591 RepID=A0A2N6PGD1_9MICO|nr:DUF6049 family protein [Brevibacterium luteolum]PMB97742.1 hypothetical protein CJ198_10120 [Brevibacterium luteolum]